jgi:CheY-like chemotaxis protein
MLLTAEGNQHGSFEASKKEETASESSSPAGDKLRVLVVEDDPSDVELVLRALPRGGFDPGSDIAQTETDFEEHVRKNAYDVVLADYNLPSWNGVETVDALRREGTDILVVLVSGS